MILRQLALQLQLLISVSVFKSMLQRLLWVPCVSVLRLGHTVDARLHVRTGSRAALRMRTTSRGPQDAAG